eukprot:jgi/Galph1/5565/GphlegSOOS_G4210.1
MTSEEFTSEKVREKDLAMQTVATKFSLAAAVDRLLVEPSFIEALYSNERLQSLLNEIERLQDFTEILHVRQRNILIFLKSFMHSEDTFPALVWDYVAEQLLSALPEEWTDEERYSKLVAQLKALAVVTDAERYEGSQRLSLLQESIKQIFAIKEHFNENVINYLSLKAREVQQQFKGCTSAKKFKAAILAYFKKHPRQNTVKELESVVAELEAVLGEPWLQRMCKQLYGLLSLGGVKDISSSKRRLSEPPPNRDKLHGVHFDVGQVQKVFESHYALSLESEQDDGSNDSQYPRMLPTNAMPSLNYAILNKQGQHEKSLEEHPVTSFIANDSEKVQETEEHAKKTPERAGKRGPKKRDVLTEPQPDAKEVTWDSVPSTQKEETDETDTTQQEKPVPSQDTSSFVLKRVEKRKMSPIKNETDSESRSTRKKKHSYHRWDEHQDYLLKKGIEKYGTGEWKAILDDPELDWPPYRTNVQLKDRARTLKII